MAGKNYTVDFSDGAWDDLSHLAAAQGKSIAEVLGNAIALQSWFDEMQEQGNRVLVERPSGRVLEVSQRS